MADVFIKQFIEKLHTLIKCKELQESTLLKAGRKDSDEYKQIPFKLKYYRQWYNMINNITDWPPIADTCNMGEWFACIKDKYKLQDSLITKMREVHEHGTILELNSLQPITLNPATTTSQQQTTQPTTLTPATTTLNPATPPQQTISMSVEAVPKKLALEGERPDDSDPHGQRIYDMRLIHGFGEKNAAEYVNAGCTLEILLADWAKFAAHPDSQGGLLDKDYIMLDHPAPHLSEAKIFAQKEEILRARLAKVSSWLPKLHHDQLIGIKYFKDTAQKIPREEIDKIQKYCQLVAKSLHSGFELMCCGSYRRGRARSGDVDCLMMHADLKTPEDIAEYERINGSIIMAMVTLLKKLTFITDYFTIGETKFMGICRLPSNTNTGATYTTFRHIDIRFVPYNSRGTAMLYFTGSFEYNKQMRQHANAKGYMLSEYGIYKYTYTKDTNGNNKKIKGEQIATPFYTEEAVCEWLGVPFIPPHERDI